MAFWNSTLIKNIFTGADPGNRGDGDPIRNAFNKVDENFANVSAQLSQFYQDWTNANVEYNLNAGFANFNNLFVSNATGTAGNFTGTFTANNLVGSGNIYSQGTLYSGNIVPLSSGVYSLGSPSNPFDNIYVQNTVSTKQINQSSDSGILKIHANASIGDTQDTGILGNITSDYNGSNTYAFFGHQYTTNNFIYKITNNDSTKGNNIVVGGVYGNAQLGSLLLSNTTSSTSSVTGALIVAGGAGIAGSLNVAGNITQGGYNILTTNTPGINVSNVNLISNNVTITGTNPSISTGTGGLVISYGGLGVAGNINAGGNISASGFVGPLYGTVMTSAQPNITSVGSLTSLNFGSASGTSLGVTNLTVTSNLSMSGAVLTGLSVLSVGSITTTANTTSGNVVASGFYFANGMPFISGGYGNTQVAAYIPTSPAIYTLQANIGAYEITTNANLGTVVNNVQTMNANVGAYETWANTSINSLRTSANANTAAYLTQFNGSIVPSANLTYNLGSTSAWWNNIYGTAIHAQYADLAERYLADSDYTPGTVVVFGGDAEITVTNELADERVAGAISTDPAYLMNGNSPGLAVALRGKVPVKLFGPVTKGDSLVTHYKSGYAISVGRNRTYGSSVFAKSLETNLSPGEKMIMAVII